MTGKDARVDVPMAAKKPAPLEKGRQAYEQRDHLRAFEELSAADRAEPLFGPDLERLGKSAGLLGRDEEYLKAFERAHHLYLEAGDNVSAARTTFWLGARLMGGGERSRAAGWFARGQRLLDECGEDCVERGYFLIPASRRQLSREGDRYVVIADDQRYTAKQVVVAMATYQKPRVPEFARELDRGIVQLHSIGYRNPSQFKEGAVLIVGAGNSGSEIALEAARHGHETWIAGRDTGHIPFRIDGLPARLGLLRLVLRGIFHRVLTLDTPLGRRVRPKLVLQGGPLIRVKPQDLTAAGVRRALRVAGVRDGKPMLVDGRILDVANVVWATGFHPGFSWVDLPILDEHGEPKHVRGVVDGEPGLYFVGLHFLYAPSSTMIHGAARDAGYVADVIARRAGQTARPQTA